MTVKSLVDPTIKPEQLARPGHIFPLLLSLVVFYAE